MLVQVKLGYPFLSHMTVHYWAVSPDVSGPIHFTERLKPEYPVWQGVISGTRVPQLQHC